MFQISSEIIKYKDLVEKKTFIDNYNYHFMFNNNKFILLTGKEGVLLKTYISENGDIINDKNKVIIYDKNGNICNTGDELNSVKYNDYKLFIKYIIGGDLSLSDCIKLSYNINEYIKERSKINNVMIKVLQKLYKSIYNYTLINKFGDNIYNTLNLFYMNKKYTDDIYSYIIDNYKIIYKDLTDNQCIIKIISNFRS
jgi:hypothetical protein